MLKKNFITAAVITFLLTGSLTVNAEQNDLIKMDIKRSVMNDAVDVTFYTTGGATNSVVTRKGDNRYVVLLPNVSGSPSVAPNIGGVKDLISDVNVKNVDDGIGGYTKVTFTTTKPVKIQTTTRKTAPLTQAQQDYKNLIATNQNKPAAVKTETKSAPAKPVAASTPANKSVSTTTPKKNVVNEPKANTPNNIKQVIAKVQPAKQPTPKIHPVKTEAKNPIKPEIVPVAIKTPAIPAPKAISAAENNANTPKMKFDENGKRIVDLEPRVDHNIGTTATKPEEKSENTDKIENDTPEIIPEQLPIKKENKIPMIPIAGLGTVLGLFLISRIFNGIFKKKSEDFKMPTPSYANENNETSEYQDIMEDESLNWQEKYKRYTQQDSEKNKINKIPGYSYVTNLGANKKSIISIDDVNLPNNKPKTKKEVLDTVRSQLEHSYNNTVSEPIEENNFEIQAEENIITENLSNAKLKSFAKNIKLSEANRNILANEKKVVTSPLKESKFVKLKNSALSMSRRNSRNADLNISDLLRTGNKYLDNRKSEVLNMDEKKENYVLSSLDEYLSILDSEDNVKTKTSTEVAHALSKMKPDNVMSRSGITNPMTRTNPMSKSNNDGTLNGLIVKSGYNIDNEKGFYLVNLDGISALVGKIKDEVFVLKKFDKVIDTQLQVRLDYGSVYIVRAGGYKCLVDVSNNKMGTLLEI